MSALQCDRRVLTEWRSACSCWQPFVATWPAACGHLNMPEHEAGPCHYSQELSKRIGWFPVSTVKILAGMNKVEQQGASLPVLEQALVKALGQEALGRVINQASAEPYRPYAPCMLQACGCWFECPAACMACWPGLVSQGFACARMFTENKSVEPAWTLSATANAPHTPQHKKRGRCSQDCAASGALCAAHLAVGQPCRRQPTGTSGAPSLSGSVRNCVMC